MSERVLEVPAFTATIFVGGDERDARRLCREFCMEGLCVTVTPTLFVYTQGVEDGVAVGLVNYPRFPSTPEAITERAERLARHLMAGLYQSSALVQTPNRAIWITTREV